MNLLILVEYGVPVYLLLNYHIMQNNNGLA